MCDCDCEEVKKPHYDLTIHKGANYNFVNLAIRGMDRDQTNRIAEDLEILLDDSGIFEE